MKPTGKCLYITFVVLLSTLFSNCSTNAQPPVVDGSTFSSVRLPSIPTKLDFASEQVPLHNFDTRESLEKELIITMYMHSRTTQALLNSSRYFAIIEPILERNGIPADFKYLCVAESGLTPNVVSVAGAVGLWQLMPGMGKEFELEMGDGIDERYHIEKSTEAACKYLKQAYARFKSWTLAAASYNLGMAGLNRRMEKQKINNYYDLFLPEETMRYVFRILAFKMVMQDPEAYGFMIHKADYHKTLDQYITVEVNDIKIDWSVFAISKGTTYKMLRELNPWIREYDFDNKSKRTYTVKIPKANFRK